MPVAMLTGLFTWWLNYLARPMRAVTLKIIMSAILLIAATGALLWTDILARHTGGPGDCRDYLFDTHPVLCAACIHYRMARSDFDLSHWKKIRPTPSHSFTDTLNLIPAIISCI